ncbi:NADH-quinone oxidoreductase subunit C [Streptomyces sp. Qhu_M48]|uniref:NADH-quinone oxidoreductase subunit C n=1 Tax=Streptomyces sp. Qhu_M48 TaxID=3435889 RepID=UPI003F4FFA0B
MTAPGSLPTPSHDPVPETAYDSLPGAVTEIFGEEATAEQAYDLLTVDVPPESWITALETARSTLGCTYFDWLSAVDEPGTGFRVCAHVVSLAGGRPRRLLVRTTVPHAAPALPTAVGVYAGAGWHERETHEMFGVDFTGHPHLVPLLLPENFEGHPLRKDFVLAARVAKAWPGAKEPGESHDGGGPKRRQMLPPGVPDPNEWGPLKGQLPPAPTRPARAAAGDRPVRRARSVTEGSASQPEAPSTGSPATPPAMPPATTPDAPAAPPRRSRSVSEGSASQTAPASDGTPAAATPEPPTRPPRRSRSAADGSASQAAPAEGSPSRPAPERGASAPEPGASAQPGASAPEPGASIPGPAAEADTPPAPASPPRRSRSAADGSASQAPPDGPEPREPREPAAGPAAPRTRSADAPWHHARPAFDEEPTAPPEAAPEPTAPAEPGAPADTGTDADADSDSGPRRRPDKPDPDTPDPTTPAGGDPA